MGFVVKDQNFETFINEFEERGMRSLFEVFESVCMGAIAVDLDCKIIWLSEQYEELLHGHVTGYDNFIGLHVEEVVPNSLLRHVIDTQTPILLDLMRLGDKWVIVTRVPLFDEKNGCVGAMGFIMMNNQENLKPLLSKVELLQQELTKTKKQLASHRQSKYTFTSFIGTSKAVKDTKAQARKAAQLDRPVLLLGETGTGKELLAHAIHASSLRSHGPFVSLNVAAIPENLLEAEFFGTAPGAYTGADRKGREGKLKLAEGGSLFLDEIGDMPLVLQSKLLRVLQEKEFEPVGSNTVLRTNFRVIAATSRNLDEMVKKGEFRADLYYRLNVLEINIPALRERLDDLSILAAHFLEKKSEHSLVGAYDLSEEALEVCKAYNWPGNVRELENVLERASAMASSTLLSASDLIAVLPVQNQQDLASSKHATHAIVDDRYDLIPLDEMIADLERQAIHRALILSNYNKQKASQLLKITRGRLYDRMKALGISINKS